MALKMFSVDKIDRPQLIFNEHKIASNPIEGLLRFGPWDLNTRNFKKINLCVIAPNKVRQSLTNFMRSLSKIAQELLQVKLQIWKEIYLMHSQTKSTSKYMQSINRQLNVLPSSGRLVILQVLDKKELPPKNSTYYMLRINMLTKEKPIPVQSILTQNVYVGEEEIIARNLILGIYTKAGGRPWKLFSNVSSFFEQPLYIGYETAKSDAMRKVCSTVIYDNKGQFIDLSSFEVPSTNSIISRNTVKMIFKRILHQFVATKKVDALIFHKDGEVYQKEVDGITDAVKEFNDQLKFAIVSFPRTSTPYLLEKSNGRYRLVEPGHFFYIGKQRDQLTFLLQTCDHTTKQSEIKKTEDIISQRINNLLIFRVAKISHNLLKDNLINLYKDITRQVLSLSKLNWGSSIGKARTPITVHLAHKILKLLISGLKPSQLERDKIWIL